MKTKTIIACSVPAKFFLDYIIKYLYEAFIVCHVVFCDKNFRKAK